MSRQSMAAGMTGLLIGLAGGFFLGREAMRAELRSSLAEAVTGLSDVLAPSASADPVTPAPVVPSSHGWSVSEDKSPMDDSRTVTLSLDADSAISAWPSETHTPTLIIRCREKATDLYIVNGTAPNVEYGELDGARVRLRLDSAAAFTQTWGKSTDDKALFARGAVTLAKRLAKADRLTYQFTPFNSSPATTTFSLAGLAEHLPKVASACGWRLD